MITTEAKIIITVVVFGVALMVGFFERRRKDRQDGIRIKAQDFFE